MTNTELLRRRITSSGYKLTFIAQKCGLTYQGFLNKLNNESEFRSGEIMAIRELLNIPCDEADEIFFAQDVDKSST
jgi:hypothetical protein